MVMDEYLVAYLLFATCLFFIFGTVILRIRTSRFPKILAMVSGIIAIVASFVWAVPGLSPAQVELGWSICALFYAIFVLVSIVSLSKRVFVTDQVTTERIVGSICIYLLLGLFFAFIYAIVNMDFNIGFKMKSFYDYIYFSFSVLTTTGFGDIVPTSSVTKIIASMEEVIGALYIAIVVARLVGLQIADKISKK